MSLPPKGKVELVGLQKQTLTLTLPITDGCEAQLSWLALEENCASARADTISDATKNL
jgi:hypothetical protein